MVYDIYRGGVPWIVVVYARLASAPNVPAHVSGSTERLAPLYPSSERVREDAARGLFAGEPRLRRSPPWAGAYLGSVAEVRP